MATLSHLGDDGGIDASGDASTHLLGSSHHGNLRAADAEFGGHVGHILEQLLLLLQVGQRDDGAVGDHQQLVVVGVLDDGDMGQRDIRRAEAAFFVKDGAHVFVGGQQTLHQDVGFAGINEVASHGSSFHIDRLMNDFEAVGVDVLGFAHLSNHVFITDEGGLNETFLHGSVHCTNRVIIVGVCSH